jgi:hypothetical protein
MIWQGTLMASFQTMGMLHIGTSLEGYPNQGETNDFLEVMKGKKVRVTVEEV